MEEEIVDDTAHQVLDDRLSVGHETLTSGTYENTAQYEQQK